MKNNIKLALGLSLLALTTHAAAQITFYQSEGFRGRAFTTGKPINNFERSGFNDAASSVIVDRGRWEICSDANFGGRCVVLRPGNYTSLSSMGMNNRVSSVRPAGRGQYVEAPPPPPAPVYEYRRRANEKVFEAPVTSVHAVYAPGGRRCWVERQQVADGPRGEPNVGGAVLGAIIGGVIGHQIGGGRGNDVATAGGAVAGGLVGSNVGREGGSTSTQDVRRCEKVASGPPEFWDVTYRFRNVDHRIQMSAPPGRTVSVNQRGEPRQ